MRENELNFQNTQDEFTDEIYECQRTNNTYLIKTVTENRKREISNCISWG